MNAKDILPLPFLYFRQRRGADHPAVGHDADRSDIEPARQSLHGSNLADKLLFAVNSAGEVTVAGGTGNGYMFSQLQGAVNPSGWSGMIRVKNPAGIIVGYILLYSNP